MSYFDDFDWVQHQLNKENWKHVLESWQKQGKLEDYLDLLEGSLLPVSTPRSEDLGFNHKGVPTRQLSLMLPYAAVNYLQSLAYDLLQGHPSRLPLGSSAALMSGKTWLKSHIASMLEQEDFGKQGVQLLFSLTRSVFGDAQPTPLTDDMKELPADWKRFLQYAGAVFVLHLAAEVERERQQDEEP